VKAPSGEGGNV